MNFKYGMAGNFGIVVFGQVSSYIYEIHLVDYDLAKWKSRMMSCVITWMEIHMKLTLTDFSSAVCFPTFCFPTDKLNSLPNFRAIQYSS